MSLGDQADDQTLLRGWQAGDSAAGEALVRRHFDHVYRFLRRRMGDASAATDLAQRTFMICVEKRERLEPQLRFRAYALGIARNLMLRNARDTGRRQAATVPDSPNSLITPSRVVAQREEHALLLAALRTLPADLQATLELHYWDELSTKEIGLVLGVAAGTIKWRLSRARALLRERIEARATPLALREATLSRLDHWARSLGGSDPRGEGET